MGLFLRVRRFKMWTGIGFRGVLCLLMLSNYVKCYDVNMVIDTKSVKYL